MATEEFNDDLPIDSPERKRLPLLLRRAVDMSERLAGVNRAQAASQRGK